MLVNSKWVVPLVVTLGWSPLVAWGQDRDVIRPDLRIGESGVVDFGSIESIASTPTGELVVLDGKYREVFVFDTRGHLRRKFGRRGWGPAEFQTPTHVAVALDGRISVADRARGRIYRFSPGGVSEGSSPIHTRESLDASIAVGLRGHIEASVVPERAEPLLLFHKDQDGNAADTLTLPPHEPRYLVHSVGNKRTWIRRSYVQGFVWAATLQGVVVQAVSPAIGLNIISPNNRSVLRHEAPVRPREIPSGDRQRSREWLAARIDQVSRDAGRQDRRFLERASPFVERIPATYSVYQLAPDPDGRVWAVSVESPADSTLRGDLFDMETGFLGSVLLHSKTSSPLPQLAATAHYLFLKTELEDGTPVIDRYTLPIRLRR
jgi:hypothetical protein